ncbi:RodZ family helix-turn-helix domain-containing protein [Leptolyngbya sp. FACHB-261]|uniref:helix-turn-helix domain-containing protein n=1 Tax=Leptolyngbya sp. FACHB-261 TaxID=2692806 RepID=UPI0016833C25|nr:helix-turn-helix domain-containing protein [Leptolyngbya sp. FACHB-261]MBD2104198.1 helix-turn-helix domain-containing protein [Leptolyngbya sp. FACHB-261]
MRSQGLESASHSLGRGYTTSLELACNEVCQTDVFQQTVTQLQAQLGSATTEVKELLEQVALTSAQLGFHRGLAQAQAHAPMSNAMSKVKVRSKPAQAKPQPQPPQQPRLRRNQSREAIQATQSEALRRLGEQLREARLAQGLSLMMVHSRTLVPLYHLESLETGQVEKLPEVVYVRGFIRRIAPLLGLDGNMLSAQIPDSDPVYNVVPSWHHPSVQADYSIYAYACCVAVTVGALGSVPYFAQIEATPNSDNGSHQQQLPAQPSMAPDTSEPSAMGVTAPEVIQSSTPERLRLG